MYKIGIFYHFRAKNAFFVKKNTKVLVHFGVRYRDIN